MQNIFRNCPAIHGSVSLVALQVQDSSAIVLNTQASHSFNRGLTRFQHVSNIPTGFMKQEFAKIQDVITGPTCSRPWKVGGGGEQNWRSWGIFQLPIRSKKNRSHAKPFSWQQERRFFSQLSRGPSNSLPGPFVTFSSWESLERHWIKLSYLISLQNWLLQELPFFP